MNNYPDIGTMTWSGYQKQRMFHNLADGSFKEIGAEAGVDNDLDGRGIGVGDFDNDGMLDIYQTNANQPTLFFHGMPVNPGNWVELKLVGTKSNRNAVGARVILTADGETYLREVNGGNGYAGQSTFRLHFGIGKTQQVDAVEIRWPSGLVEKLSKDHVKKLTNKIRTVQEGKGIIR
jgi:hypothetical protein